MTDRQQEPRRLSAAQRRQAVAVEQLVATRRARGRAEYAELVAMVAYRDVEVARIGTATDRSSMWTLVANAGIALDIGQESGLPEREVMNRLHLADQLREQAPRTWAAFKNGDIDLRRTQKIHTALDRLERPESRERLDRQAPAYAATHTVPELTAWLRRLVIRLEEDLALERAEQERADRHVSITHGDDGMSWIEAYIPSPVAAAVAARLTRAAQTINDPDDDRTLDQRRADLLGAWLTTSEATSTRLVADIAVTVPAQTAAGATDGFAVAADGSWVAPAGWLLDQSLAADSIWHRLIVDPVTDDVLAHDYIGRFAPEKLAKAILFRDGRCRAPGCMKSADRCDLDHREPWPIGRTNGSNMWALCRRHHAMKSHQVITWTLPSGRQRPAETARSNPPPAEDEAA